MFKRKPPKFKKWPRLQMLSSQGSPNPFIDIFTFILDGIPIGNFTIDNTTDPEIFIEEFNKRLQPLLCECERSAIERRKTKLKEIAKTLTIEELQEIIRGKNE